MSSSTLDLTGEEAPVTGLGHGTAALGPSDSSDSGSDVVGGPGMDEGLSDDQAREAPYKVHGNAGRDLGDVDLSSDTDRYGTGERSSAGVESPAAFDQSTTVYPGVDDSEETAVDGGLDDLVAEDDADQ